MVCEWWQAGRATQATCSTGLRGDSVELGDALGVGYEVFGAAAWRVDACWAGRLSGASFDGLVVIMRRHIPRDFVIK